jgi:cell division protein FtsX
MKETWIRRGKVIIDPDGRPTDHKTINAAKRASRDLQKGGSIVKAEAEKAKTQIRSRSRVRSSQFASRAEERRAAHHQMGNFAQPLTQAQLDEIARGILKPT